MSNGLISMIVPTTSQRVDLVGGRTLNSIGAPTSEIISSSQVLRTNGSSSGAFVPIRRRTLNAFSLIAIQQAVSPATDTRSLSLGNSASDQPLLMLNTGAVTASRIRLFIRNDAGLSDVVDSTLIAPYDGNIHVIGLSYAFGVGCFAYSDGIRETQTLPGTRSGFTVDQFAIGLLKRTGNGSWWSGRTWLACAFDRLLTDDIHVRIAADPWGMLLMPKRIWTAESPPVDSSFNPAWVRQKNAIIGSGVR